MSYLSLAWERRTTCRGQAGCRDAATGIVVAEHCRMSVTHEVIVNLHYRLNIV
jgi:hypothetical protein